MKYLNPYRSLTQVFQIIILTVFIFHLKLPAQAFDGNEIIKKIDKVIEYQKSRPMVPKRKDRAFPNGWIPSTFYAGVMEVYKTTGISEYYSIAKEWSEKNDWQLGPRKRHADDHCSGQTYLELFFIDEEPRYIESIRDTVDFLIEHPRSGRVDWDWCDALFMSPPAIALLYKATGEIKYSKFLEEMYWDSADYLFDREERLFYRDSRYFFKRSDNQQKIFWSRGNGWVITGLVRILNSLPADYKHKEKYHDLYLTLAFRLHELQPVDGVWRTNLLEPEQYPAPETSGTSFFCYALAWGINNGILKKEIFLEDVLKSWKALYRYVDDNGKLQYVQNVGHEPVEVEREDNQAYGAGAFLMAASEIIKLIENEHD